MSRTVLIADADVQRADRLRESCAARGYSTRSVCNGPEALEAAVSDAPEVLVLGGELSWIENGRLLEILRANPRTRRTQVIALGAAREPAEAWGVEHLSDEIDPDEVGERIGELLRRTSQLDAVAGEAREEVEGQLGQIALADLLQLFHLNRRTGSFELRRRARDGRPERGRIHLVEGDVVQATAGAVAGEKALFRLLTWNDGSFAFRPEPPDVARGITTSTRALLMEGMRQLDEWTRAREELPSLDAHVALRVRPGELPNVVHPLTQEVLLLLELYSRVRELVDRCSFPDYQVLRTLQTLEQRGLVDLRAEALPAASDTQLFAPAQVRRLRSWLSRSQPEGGPVPDAKVVVAAAEPERITELLRVLAELPGVQLTGEALAGGVGTIARLRVNEEFGLEFVQAPTDEIFAPIWPLLGHGALGVWLLSDDSPSEGLDRLEQVLAEQPRARTFGLRLLSPGATAPDAGAVADPGDGANPCLWLSLDPAQDPSEGLRGALARLMP